VLEAPFPYFGGKRSVAHHVWSALGNVKHYIEPFFGSGAVLLARPEYSPQHHVETVCDKDGHIANVWRALQDDPDEVAKWCDWPVNHADLSARKIRMIANMETLLSKLIEDDTFYDAKMAGYWIWAASCWIGRGLMTLTSQIPHIGNAGMGVHRLSPIPHLSRGGAGVHRRYHQHIYSWFRDLSERLRRVRVVCGDWTRVCGGSWQDKIGTCGIFFDPPYGIADRDDDIYSEESLTVAHDVRTWAIERGDKPTYRIVIAGYEEHQELIDKHGWTSKSWSSSGGYGNTCRDGEKGMGANNRTRERLYFSPHCLNSQTTLFTQAEERPC
jgi:DNA adenine methylase